MAGGWRDENNVICDQLDCGSGLFVPRKRSRCSQASLLARHRVHVQASCGRSTCAIELRPQIRGVIPRLIQDGDPLQMLNPFAPAKYGTAEENTVLDPDAPGRGDGIKLLSVSF